MIPLLLLVGISALIFAATLLWIRSVKSMPTHGRGCDCGERARYQGKKAAREWGRK